MCSLVLGKAESPEDSNVPILTKPIMKTEDVKTEDVKQIVQKLETENVDCKSIIKVNNGEAHHKNRGPDTGCTEVRKRGEH